jgi:hypothetical protein
MVVIKRMGVLSVAKIESLIFAFIGLIEGILVSLASSAMKASAPPDMPLEFQLGVWAIIALPIIYWIIGFVFGALGAAIYNLFAKWVGGFEVEFEDKNAVAKKQVKK